MSFLREALKGAKADIDSAGSELLPRLARTARVARILGLELAAIVALAPYGAYAMSVYRRLPSVPPGLLPPPPPPPSAPGNQSTAAPPQPPAPTLGRLPLGRDGVAVHRQVSYGSAGRNTLDVYVPLSLSPPPPPPPPAGGAGQQQQQQERPTVLLPVVFFVHGGVWASGETWQYAPMATRMAQEGIVVVVPTYTLYPEALAGTMVEEVSSALTWTFDNVRRYGGDPARVTAAGHSAGGHLVAWALLRRAAAAEAAAAAVVATRTATATTLLPSPQPMSSSAQSPSADASGQPQAGSPASVGGHDNGASHQAHEDARRRQDEQRERRRRDEQQEEQQPQGSAAHSGDRRDTAAYLLGGGGASLPGAIHALRAVADAQMHPQPGVDTSYDGVDGAVAAAAAAVARPTHTEADSRMPRVFVGMSAVYDIAKHYEFEKSRAVHELSMMKRAVGGPAGFAAASPSVILARAAEAAEAAVGAGAQTAPAAGGRNASGGDGGGGDDGHLTSYFHSFELLGDAIPARAGLSAHGGGSGGSASSRLGGAELEPRFSVAAARRLPPFVVMGSCSDHMVPWHEGGELVHQLRRCGVPVRHLMYNHVGHGDFVMAWHPVDLRARKQQRPQAGGGRGGEDADRGAGRHGHELEGLLPCARDLLQITQGRVRPVSEGGAEGVGVEGGSAAAQVGLGAGYVGEGDGAWAARSRM